MCSENLDKAYITFGERPMSRLLVRYLVDHNFIKNESLDVAILHIKNCDERLPHALYLQKHLAQNLSDVHLVGYGHTRYDGKYIDIRCEVVHPNSVAASLEYVARRTHEYKHDLQCKGKDPSIVDEGYAGYDDEHKLLLHTSMEYGASGSPIIQVTRSGQEFAVVGVFRGALPKFYFELSDEMRKQFPDEHRIEYGIRMSRIYNELCNYDPSLAEELFGCAQNQS